jgi:ABC-2 type transport system permease protein
VNASVFRLTARALLLQRRTWALAALAFAPVLIAFVFALAAKGDVNHLEFYSNLMQKVFVPTIAALVALVLGVSTLGDERDDGTILYLVATPIPRINLIVTKVAAAWFASMVLLLPSLLLCAVFSAGSSLTVSDVVWPAIGVALACLAYCGASVWLSLRVRRPVIVGILYILLWEGSIANFAPSAHKLSIGAYGKALVAHALPQGALPTTGAATAIVVLAAVTALGCWLGARLLSRVELP